MKGTNKVVTVCRGALATDSGWSLAHMVRSSNPQPCTNSPVECPRCAHRNRFVWKYNMRNHWKAEHAREHGGLPEGTKKLVALASGEKLRVERRARKLGWWEPQQHVPCEKDDE